MIKLKYLTVFFALLGLSFMVFAYDNNTNVTPTPPVNVSVTPTILPNVSVTPSVTPNYTSNVTCPKSYIETDRLHNSIYDNILRFNCTRGDLKISSTDTDHQYTGICCRKVIVVENFTCAPFKFPIKGNAIIRNRLERLCLNSRGTIKYGPPRASQEWCCGARKRIEETSVQNYAEKKAKSKQVLDCSSVHRSADCKLPVCVWSWRSPISPEGYIIEGESGECNFASRGSR